MENITFQSSPFMLPFVSRTDYPVPHRIIWCLGIPSQIAFFLWNALLDKYFYRGPFKKQGMELGYRCIMCLGEEESVNHLSVHCLVGSKVGNFFLSYLRVDWSFSFSIKDLIFVGGSKVWRGSIWWFTIFSHGLFAGLFGRKEIGGSLRVSTRNDVLIATVYNSLFDWISIREDFLIWDQ